ncbi:hypothetical protein [Georgenia alba]|uniref:Uncharacterized protein n=1 Tax=Georgenia alba TaxID=2233858 RepID=A0ABW2QD87_9MICO
MWWIVWLVLVVAGAGLLALLGYGLWRRVKALGRELRDLSGAVERLESASAVVPEPGTRHRPGPLRDPATLASARATRERVAQERDEARTVRLARAVARWRALKLLE